MIIFETIKQYLILGITHVFPLGYDHILFIVSIFIINTSLKPALIQCSLFTIAHSISLILTSYDLIIIEPKIIEPLIAFSILFTALENIVVEKINKLRFIFIFIFGLIHGIGFANALKENGISNNNFFTALFSFNVGIEISQVAIILILFFMFTKWFANKVWYKKRIVYPVSSIIGCIALYWMINLLIFLN